MMKMRIKQILGDRIVLEDMQTGSIYSGSFEFMDVVDRPAVGDAILWAEKNCTDPEECVRGDLGFRIYGPYTTEGCMRTGSRITEIDVLVLIKENSTYLLHRYYG